MVDNLSGGRLVAGFVSTTAPSLYAYNLSAAEERARYHEAYDLLAKAWTEEHPFEWHSDYYHYQCVSILPRPLQIPHPPVWTVAASAESLQWAANRQMGLMTSGPVTQAADTLSYYRTYAQTECGWSPLPAQLGMAREFFIAPTMAGVQTMLERAPERGGEATFAGVAQAPELEALRRAASSMRTYDYRSSARSEGGRRGDDAMQSGAFLLGDPDSITEQIIQQHAATGAGVLAIRPELGGMSLDEAADGLALFAREVLPVVQKL
jgi:alkanesulfonate monooxygenase SsuD/methylene tetrahydromethanopterin reductase-like flavin-dependent oxidoreductase (luciferase family)